MTRTVLAALLLLCVLPSSSWSQDEALRQYVAQADGAFSFEPVETIRSGTTAAHVLRLTSQEWRGIKWHHRLTIVVPPSVQHPETAMLYISGGSNRNRRPVNLDDGPMNVAIQIANQTGIAVAVLEQVPNQPLLHQLYEDDLIAHTFVRYIETGEPDWPLLFPMVKSATRAMDAVTAFLAEKTGRGPDHFIVTGASKRGWTAWLSAVVEPRVAAIAPMVFDILNFPPQLELQQASFEGYSEQIRAYEERNLFALLETEAGQALGETVDPFTYRNLLHLPKLILLGTNDPYWSVDAARLYFGHLPEPKHLLYAANSGHRFDPTMTPTLLAFVHHFLQGSPMPRLQAETTADGELTATWSEDAEEVWHWTAHSETRDFRTARWQPERVTDQGNQATVALNRPVSGYSAHYIEARFPSPHSPPFGLSTEIRVISSQPTLTQPESHENLVR
jgi:PhoPQ-activated pathogenicity-related protein